MFLAQRSPWFHRFFQSHTATEYHIALFNINEQTVRAAIDVMSGKELVMSVREKNRVVNLLSRLEVKCAEEELTTEDVASQEMSRDNQSDKSSRSQNPSMKPPTSSRQTEILPPFPLPPAPPAPTASPGVATNVEKEKTETEEKSCKNDFYAILDQFTVTSHEELNRINHMMMSIYAKNVKILLEA